MDSCGNQNFLGKVWDVPKWFRRPSLPLRGCSQRRRCSHSASAASSGPAANVSVGPWSQKMDHRNYVFTLWQVKKQRKVCNWSSWSLMRNSCCRKMFNSFLPTFPRKNFQRKKSQLLDCNNENISCLPESLKTSNFKTTRTQRMLTTHSSLFAVCKVFGSGYLIVSTYFNQNEIYFAHSNLFNMKN